MARRAVNYQLSQNNPAMHHLIRSGSTGNAILYHGSILVDIGVPYALIKEFQSQIQLVLLTHQHLDHINLKTLKKLCAERPTLRVGACEWMRDKVKELRNVDIYEIGKLYDYGQFKISPFKLYHDVPNCGYRIFKENTRIFHATDTAHLKGITAKEYDLYAIEHNYNEELALKAIEQAEREGKFCHFKGSINSHLSEEQAKDFIFNNKAEHSQVLRLHETKSYL